ncbi:MAG TPA: malto-oligosyltrehalose synthase [Methylomirabilota bacterium]|nr:malto-oligosyltrehalose synthase [Methylomirabilota bacterium]
MRTPRATYRLQLGPDLTFDDAAALLDYLKALGVSDCYTSPFLETATHGSHGYDVSDHGRLREELGGEAAFERFATALRERDMGLLVDVVPNHMGIARNRNAWWYDVLENGAASAYASYFDIDWHPVKSELADKVLLPILGEQYGTVLDKGELRLSLEDGRFVVHYYETVLPISPRSYGRILGHRIDTLSAELGGEHPDVVRLKSLITWFATLPPRTEKDPERLAARRREKEIGRDKLLALLAESEPVRAFVAQNIEIFNGTPGAPRRMDLLDDLLAEQAYRVAYWRVAGEEINYRRFFDINDLAAIRMEDPEVFEAAHRLVFRLVRDGVVTGLRIDHPDGLYNPAEYFRRLQRGAGGDFYVVAEKILAPGEQLPESWETSGTTGYEFLNLLNGVFVDRSNARAMEHIYLRLIKTRPSFSEIVHECKRLITETSMASELNVLGHRLNTISEKHRASRDFTLGSLTRALRETIVGFPVYRTYVDGQVSARDREYIARAIAHARRGATTDATVYDWLQRVLTLEAPAAATEADIRERLDFVMRFQQITGPVTAKGFEDTALYRFNRLVSLNEVGGDPSRFGVSLAEFHAENAARLRRSPHSLSATATHDTKRGEDVRARINVLSEIPDEWRSRVGAWQRLNRRHRGTVDGAPVPGANTEYLIYQTLVGVWPIDAERLTAYLLKAVREAKTHTSWINPNAKYDAALTRFAQAIVDRERAAAFLDDFGRFQARIAQYGAINSLAQTLLKITAPGVPDFYQGTELWDLSLVDPDNRRPVDWKLRQRLLGELEQALASTADRAALAHDLWLHKDDARVKLFLVHEALAFRRARPTLFATGAYRPLEARGALAEHVCAFARVAGESATVTVVPRLLARRGGEATPLGAEYWGDTTLDVPAELGGRVVNVLTGETLEGDALPLGRVLARFPVALLERRPA